VKPSGTGDTVYALVNEANYEGFAPNPAVANQVVFGYQASSSAAFGIYSNSSVSVTGATSLVGASAGYQAINQMQVSNDGQWVYYTALLNANDVQYALFRVPIAGGTPTQIAPTVDFFQLNMAGTTIVFDQLNGSVGNIYTVSSSGGTPSNLTNSSSDEIMPQWSKDGTKIAYCSTNGGVTYNIFTMTSSGGSQTQITKPGAGVDNLGPSFSGDGTMVSFIYLGSNGAQAGVYTVPSTGGSISNVIFNPSLDNTTYWTTAGGRARHAGALMFNLAERRRRLRH